MNGKGLLAGLVIAAPVLAGVMYLTLHKDEQTRATQHEMIQQQRLSDARFDKQFDSAWGDTEAAEQDQKRIARLTAERKQAEQQVAAANKAAADDEAALQQDLQKENSDPSAEPTSGSAPSPQ